MSFAVLPHIKHTDSAANLPYLTLHTFLSLFALLSLSPAPLRPCVRAFAFALYRAGEICVHARVRSHVRSQSARPETRRRAPPSE